MSDLNSVSLVGRSVADVECRFTTGGTAVADLRVASNRHFSGKEETSFFDVVAWGKTAELAGEYVKKGKQVAVNGRLQQQTWEKDGTKHSKVVIVAENLQFLSDAGERSEKSEKTSRKSKSETKVEEGQTQEEVPF